MGIKSLIFYILLMQVLSHVNPFHLYPLSQYLCFCLSPVDCLSASYSVVHLALNLF